MALRGDRNIIETDIFHTLGTAKAPGFGVCHSAGGSGIALGDMRGTFQVAADPSGLVFAGILLTNVVSLDETLYHRNFHKDEVATGNPVTVLTKGWVVTNAVSGTPAKGDKAYLTTTGNFTPTLSTTGGLVATPFAGRWEGAKDEDGYAKISINLPNNI